MSILRFLSVFLVVLVSGCAITPYEHAFQCPLSSDFGSCTDVAGAYADAVAAPSPQAAARASGPARAVSRSSRSRGTREGGAVDHRVLAPQQPSVTPPTLLRTWIRGYQGADHALFDARLVFHLAGESTIAGVDGVPGVSPFAEAIVLPLPAGVP